jgi:hypothetical protein
MNLGHSIKPTAQHDGASASPALSVRAAGWMPVKHLMNILGPGATEVVNQKHCLGGMHEPIVRSSISKHSVAPGLAMMAGPVVVNRTLPSSTLASAKSEPAPSCVPKAEDQWLLQIEKIDERLKSCEQKLRSAEDQLFSVKPEENEEVKALRQELEADMTNSKERMSGICGHGWKMLSEMLKLSNDVVACMAALKESSVEPIQSAGYHNRCLPDGVWACVTEVGEHSRCIQRLEASLLSLRSEHQEVKERMLVTKETLTRRIANAAVARQTKELSTHCEALRAERESLLATRQEFKRMLERQVGSKNQHVTSMQSTCGHDHAT